MVSLGCLPDDEHPEGLDYDFAQEKRFPYEKLSVPEAMRHIVKFASGIWELHPFGEGN